MTTYNLSTTVVQSCAAAVNSTPDSLNTADDINAVEDRLRGTIAVSEVV